jgi:cyclopropane-fatty-acyl-phospholipid synthase
MIAGTLSEGEVPYTVEFRDGRRKVFGEGPSVFSLVLSDEVRFRKFLRAGLYSAGLAFIRGEVEVRGDLFSAIRLKQATAGKGWKHELAAAAARFAPARVETWLQSKSRAGRNVRFHYDRSNDFYREFLDTRMMYSAAYYRDASLSLEEAQLAKLDQICQKLELRPGERLLDVGCGWGGLAIHAAEHYGVFAAGCTVSGNQYEYAMAKSAARGLTGRVEIRHADYRDVEGRFHKIASDGMYEHVGRHRLGRYFEKIASLLEDGGLFLNSGIVRAQTSKDGPETLFVQRWVFPGGELPRLSDVVRNAELAGFEVMGVENMRLHYALTCRDWVARLQQNARNCLRHVDPETYRTWLLYLAGSALSFEQGDIGDYQLLMRKRCTGYSSTPAVNPFRQSPS